MSLSTGLPSGTITPSSSMRDAAESGSVRPMPHVECNPLGSFDIISALVHFFLFQSKIIHNETNKIHCQILFGKYGHDGYSKIVLRLFYEFDMIYNFDLIIEFSIFTIFTMTLYCEIQF